MGKNSGTKEGKEMASVAGNIFRAKQFAGNIQMRTPGITEVGFNEGWHQINIEVPFQWDEFI